MKQLCTFILLLLLNSTLYCSEETVQSEKFHSSLNMKNHQPSSELGPDLPEALSYFEGWVRYHHNLGEAKPGKPKTFFQNNEYYSQRIPMSLVKKSDRHGLKIIPNKTSFYSVLTNEKIQIYSSRSDEVRRLVDSLEIEHIDLIPEDAYLKGGVDDIGSFSTGNCFNIYAKIPIGKTGDGNNQKTTWVFCLEKDKDKSKMMKAIIKLKLQSQRKLGKFTTLDTIKTEQKAKTAADLMAKKAELPPEDDRTSTTVALPQDGYWLLLQNWTDCTLKCGGGESYQQWQCVEPKNGGKPCQGKAIRIRKCNIQPCPKVESLLTMLKLTQPEIAKPIIKIAPFSTRPQRFEKCVLKESDAFLSIKDPKTKIENKLPTRVIMNNRTVTIYRDDTYQNIHHAYLLEKTSFIILKNKFCCFDLRDGKLDSTICGYDKNCGSPATNDWVEKWRKDFSLFKVACNVGSQETLLSPDDEKKLAEELKKKLGHARLDIMGEKEKALRQQMMLGNNNFIKSVQKTQDLGLNAIDKELRLESLIRGEEKAKEEAEINAILKKIEQEREKEACLHNSLKERDLDAEFLAERRSAEQEIVSIKQEVSKSVQMKRAKMRKLIENMRAKAKIRKAALEAELNALRQKMAQEMLNANKSGDSDKCKKGKTDPNAREEYCDKNYIDDYIRNTDCKTEENFCYMCCESEFGNMFIDRRETCYNMCDLPVPPKPPVPAVGPWKWSAKESLK